MPYDPKTGKHYDYTKEGIEKYEEETGGMPYTPFKMKGSGHYGFGNSSSAKASSPAKDNVKPIHAHTESGDHPKKQTDEEFIASAKKQKSDIIANLIKKAENQGLSRDTAKKAAEA